MKLKRLAINRLPGISQSFEIQGAGAGLYVVFGPNGVGKSSICRALEGLYWDDRHRSPETSTSAEFEWDGELWRAQREGNHTTWHRGGESRVPPNFPPSHNDRCFFLRLRDLIDPSRDGTADIASEIRRQMSGGFDLQRIASDLFPGVSRHQSHRQRQHYNNASDEAQKETVRQADLQRRADELARLRGELDEAEDAARRLVLVERAIGLARRREDLAGIEREIEALPHGLTKLTGKEVEEVERQQQQADTITERARSLERELDKAREARRETGLHDALEQSELAVWRENADELSRVEMELGTARTQRSATRSALDSAMSAIGGGDVDTITLTVSEHAEMFAFLRSSQEHAVRESSVRERLRQLDRSDPWEHEQDLDRLRLGADALRAWLRVPEPETAAARIRFRWPWLLFAAAMTLGGAGLAFLAAPPSTLFQLPGIDAVRALKAPPWLAERGWLFASLGVGVAVAAFLPGNRRRSEVAREEARAHFEEQGLDRPAEWDLPSVGSHLNRLERTIGDLEAAVEQTRDRDAERQRLENELAGLSEQATELDAGRKELGERLGLDVLRPDAELVDFARSLDQLRVARGGDEAASGKVGSLEEKHEALLTELAEVLERYGEPRPVDAATARARVHNLADRNARLVQAISDERTWTAQLDDNAAGREATLVSIRRTYAEAGLHEGDLNGLVSLVRSLPCYRDLVNEKTALEGQIRLDDAELAKAGATRLAESDAHSLERLKDQLTRLETRTGTLRDEIAQITARTDAARSGNAMEGLMAVREDARAGLRDLRDDALYAKAGLFLIDAVAEEYEHTRMPRVLERARDHFLGFTHHNYSLELGKDDGSPRLFAREARGGETRELDELSDGTRVQLLLAARIAFAEEIEQGKVLPLFLDEALDQSDPRRFESIVRNLGCVAKDQDRQMFYLTSDPMDVDRIRDALAKEGCALAGEVDLGLIRTKTASVSGPRVLRVDAGSAVPAPHGLSPEEYGAALNVPAFRPERGFTEQHVFYILWDEPDLLHDFLLNGIEWAGQWRTVSDTPLAERLGGRSVPPPEVTARLDLLETFCDLWMQGKGRPVGRAALEQCEALTERNLEDVVAMARELDGDPKRLAAALEASEDGRLRDFRKGNVEKLLRYLVEFSYLDDRPVLAEDELRLHAQTMPAAGRLPDGFANHCLRRWWKWAQMASSPP